ncbi:substrate-binding domain-containing protein [Spirillospora sp. NPDC029432]|uniref:vWA domain-containing protein n=1 Tax=Spirillospora sp. NPDC029432 TaxID=3154599 RepID=UPI0034541137
MAFRTRPRHRSIFWVDMVGSSDEKISDTERREARKGMYEAAHRAFQNAGLPVSAPRRWFVHKEDRGDGAFWLFPPRCPKHRLLDALPYLVTALEEYNRGVPPEKSLRLRVALNFGELNFDQEGVSGTWMDRTARLLDAAEFKAEVEKSGAIVGAIASRGFHEYVVMPSSAPWPNAFERLTVLVRVGRAAPAEEAAWIAFPRGVPLRDTARMKAVRWLVRVRYAAVMKARRWFRRHPRAIRAALSAALVAVALLVPAGAPRPAECEGRPVQLRVRVSPEKETLVRALALRFEQTTRDREKCRRADVNVVSASSPGGAREATQQGWLIRDRKEPLNEADVWLPDSTLDVEQAQAALWANGIGTVALRTLGSVTTSRLVVAVPAAMADDLSLSGHTMRWDELLGWPGEGYAFGRASPRASSTGLVATVALYRAALKAPMLDFAALTTDGAAGVLHDVEKSIAREDDEPGKLLCAMRESPEDGELRRTALLVSEKSLIDYRVGAPLGGGTCGGSDTAPPELRPFYAEEGMPLLDHPYVVVSRTAPLAPERRRIIHDFYRFLKRPDAQQSFKDAGYRDGSGTTTSHQADIPSLVPIVNPSGRFRDGPLMDAWNTARKSARVLFAVDVSRPMAAPFPYSKGTRVAAAADAIGLALPLMGGRDQIGLWEFADGAGGGGRDHRPLVPVGSPDEERRIERLSDRLAGLRPTGRGTGLVPALRAAIGEMRGGGDGADPAETTRAVIAITYGVDGGREVADLAADISPDDHVRVYVIAFHQDSCLAGLDQVTRASGGDCYEIDGMATMREALDGIAAGLWGAPR